MWINFQIIIDLCINSETCDIRDSNRRLSDKNSGIRSGNRRLFDKNCGISDCNHVYPTETVVLATVTTSIRQQLWY